MFKKKQHHKRRSLTQTVRAVNGETHEDDICVWVGERSQAVVVLLTRCVPESQLHLEQDGIVRPLPPYFHDKPGCLYAMQTCTGRFKILLKKIQLNEVNQKRQK